MAHFRLGTEKLFRGILNYRQTWRDKVVEQCLKVGDNHEPTAVLFSCIDTRILPTRFTSADAGDMFIVRNTANMVPKYNAITLTEDPERMISAPAAALELGFVINRIKHAVVCGHSDCKAINFLYTMRNNIDDNGKIVGLDNDTEYSPFSIWLRKHGVTTLQRYNELGKTSFTQPLILNAGLGLEQFPAYIDKDCVLSSTDKLSQINTLLQLENIASYPFMIKLINSSAVYIHALWFDVTTGEINYFSRRKQHFVEIRDSNLEALLSEIDDAAS